MNLTQIKDEAERRYPREESDTTEFNDRITVARMAFQDGFSRCLETLKPKCKTVWEEVAVSDGLPPAQENRSDLSILVSALNEDEVWIYGYFDLGREVFYHWERWRGAGIPTVVTHWLRPLTILEPESEAVKFVRWVFDNAYDNVGNNWEKLYQRFKQQSK